MPLYEITPTCFRTVHESSFAEFELKERADLQRLLRAQIEVLDANLLIIAEEFGEWEDSRRRIDLLAIDREANLVVIELKRTQDGGHMELQALRYAAMVSTMTFDRAVEVYADFLHPTQPQGADARAGLLGFLGWDDEADHVFAENVRILLVSADFGKELTSAVLWLRDREIDIRCIRLRPYQNGESKLIDVQQIIPLPEAEDYQIQVSRKEKEGRQQRSEKNALQLRFWTQLVAMAKERNARHCTRKPSEYHYLAASTGFSGISLNYSLKSDEAMVDLYIDVGDETRNKQIFDELLTHREAIEAAFGGELEWERLNHRRACRIKHDITSGGLRSPESEWPAIQSEMIDWMSRLETALLPAIGELNI